MHPTFRRLPPTGRRGLGRNFLHLNPQSVLQQRSVTQNKLRVKADTYLNIRREVAPHADSLAPVDRIRAPLEAGRVRGLMERDGREALEEADEHERDLVVCEL